MSRSRPTKRLKSPVENYFDWAGKKGELSFWDKEKKERKYFPKMKFVVLDELHTVGGFHPASDKPIRGTEVRNLKEEKIKVWVGGKEHSTGYLDDLKEDIKGLKYQKSVYIAVLQKGKASLAKLSLISSSLGAFIGFTEGSGDYDGNGKVDLYEEGKGVAIAGKSKLKKKGDNKWYEPTFEIMDISEEEEAEALRLDGILQEYFDARAGKNTDSSDNDTSYDDISDDDYEEEEEDFAEDVNDAEDFDDLPF